MTTTYLSITSEGGRLGRITWNNSGIRTFGSCRPFHCWGSIEWDRWWPEVDPFSFRFDEIRKVLQELGDAFTHINYSFLAATEAFTKFGEAVARAADVYEVKFLEPPEAKP